MPGPWSRAEVEATVADYFDMFEEQLRGNRYNKTAHRRRLMGLLDGRTEASIELKHQNISAILIELDVHYIDGYKPRFNYQQLLFDVVSDVLDSRPGLASLLRQRVCEPAAAPVVADILASMVPPPPARLRVATYRERHRPSRLVDYVSMEASNRSLGAAGEQFVVEFETARLIHAGKEKLAEKIEHVSRTRGDGLGFDVLSFESSGEERLIEVKTTKFGASTPFVATRNEVRVSRSERDRFHLYRVFSFRESPRLYSKRGALDQAFLLDPTEYVARIA